MILTVVFANYFRQVIVGGSPTDADAWWGLANFLAMAAVAFAGPLLGAAADAGRQKRLYLTLATLVMVAATASLSLPAPGQVGLTLAIYVVATFAFESGYVFYNAFLPEIAVAGKLGRISGWGWGVGFVGGLAALLLVFPFAVPPLADNDGMLIDSAIGKRRLVFPIVAAFSLIFALPALIWLRDASRVPRHDDRRSGLARVRSTLLQLRRHRQVARLIVGSLLFNDAITTVIVFAAPYATSTFGFSDREVLTLFIVMNVIAFPATVAIGYLADRCGRKRTLMATLWLWIAVVILAWWAVDKSTFWIMAVGAAVGMGGTQAVARSLMAHLAPPDCQAEFFGFYVTSGKLASTVGPLLFGLVSAWSGDQRLAVASLLPLFVGGLWLVRGIDEAEGGGSPAS